MGMFNVTVPEARMYATSRGHHRSPSRRLLKCAQMRGRTVGGSGHGELTSVWLKVGVPVVSTLRATTRVPLMALGTWLVKRYMIEAHVFDDWQVVSGMAGTSR